MLGTLFKIVIVALIVFALAAGVGLMIMAGVANTHDVRSIPIPRDTSLATLAEKWNYADAFRRPMEYASYKDIAQVVDNVTVKGDGEIHRTKNEAVFAGNLPWMQYQVAYMLDRDSFPPAIQIVTVYRFKNDRGRWLWKVYRPVHRALAPYLLDRLGSAASS